MENLSNWTRCIGLSSNLFKCDNFSINTRLPIMTFNWTLLPLAGLSALYFSNKWKHSRSIEHDRQTRALVNEVLFFPDRNHPCPDILTNMLKYENWDSICKSQGCRRLHGRPTEAKSSFLKFLAHLATAKKKVDLCIYILTQPNLASLLLGLHQKGVKIRVITDSAESEAISTKMSKLKLAGIEIKSNKKGTGALMHHKFLIVDDYLLLSGSFNWTSKAVVTNYEAVTVTSENLLVAPFIDEFEQLWTKFNEHPLPLSK